MNTRSRLPDFSEKLKVYLVVANQNYMDDVCLSNDAEGISWESNASDEKNVGLLKGIDSLLSNEEWSYCKPSSISIGIGSAGNEDIELSKQNADLNNGYCARDDTMMDTLFGIYGGLFGGGVGNGCCDPSMMMPPTSMFDCPPPTN